MVSGMIVLAQELADEHLGRRLSMDELLTLLVDSADQIFDGDDENNNVANSNNTYSRVNIQTMAEMILEMAGAEPSVPDDYGADPATAGQLAIGAAVQGEIEVADDQDWFAVDPQAGTQYAFQVSNGATLALLDDTGIPIGPSGTAISFTASTTQTHHLAVNGPVGSYSVSAQEIVPDPTPVDDYGNMAATAGAIGIGETAMGTIEEGRDQDWFAVDVV